MLKDELLSALSAIADADEVEKILDRILPRYDIHEVVHGEGGELPEAVNSYLACKTMEGCSERTVTVIRLALTLFFKKVGVDVDKVTTSQVRLYLAEYKEERHVSDLTLDWVRSVLNRFFKWCQDEGEVDKNPCGPIKKIRHEYKQRVSLSSMELEYMRLACGSVRDSALIEFLYSTGCRLSELVSAKRSNVDWRGRQVRVMGKGKRERWCYLNDKAYIALTRYLDKRKDTSDFLFVSANKNASALTPRAAETMYQKIVERTGGKVRPHSPHSMRHTTATLALAAGMPIESISKMLGHANISTTLIYAETSGEKLRAEHNKYVV